MKVAFGLGANLGEREKTLASAERMLAERVGPLLAASRIYETEPLKLPEDSGQPMPMFLNSALLFESKLAAADLLSVIRDVEFALGRRRELEVRRWQPRVIDIDLLAVENLVISEPGLEVPHPELHRRTFVLEPLAEIWPDWIHPLVGKSAADLLLELRAVDVAHKRGSR